MPVIAPSITELSMLITTFSFETVAIVLLPVIFTSLRVNSVLFDNKNPVFPSKSIVDLFSPSVAPCIKNSPEPVVPKS